MNRYLVPLLLAFITGVDAETVSSTNIQYLYGSFDHVTGDRVDGKMETITLEHFGLWEYGDNFFFADASNARYLSGKRHTVYLEWAPRLALTRITGHPFSFGPVKETYLSAQLNQGDHYQATLYGIGADLAIPGFAVFGLNLYHKEDNFDTVTTQLTLNWLALGAAGPFSWRFEGFWDQTEDDTLAQPQLLLDLGAMTHLKPQSIYAGVEHYYYRTDAFTESTPQFLVKWFW